MRADLSELPLIRIPLGRGKWQKAMYAGQADPSRSAGFTAESAHFEPDELHLFLYRRIRTALDARARGKWFGGRLYNRLGGFSEDYVPLTGPALLTVLSLIGVDGSNLIKKNQNYELRLDSAQKALEALKITLQK